MNKYVPITIVAASLVFPTLGIGANTYFFGTPDAKAFVAGFNKTVVATKKQLPMIIDDVTTWVDYHADASTKTVYADYEIADGFDIDETRVASASPGMREDMQKAICQRGPTDTKNWNAMIALGWKMKAVYRQSGKVIISFDLKQNCNGVGA